MVHFGSHQFKNLDHIKFSHAHNIRELTIEGQDMTLSRHCFAAINQVNSFPIVRVLFFDF